MRRLSRIIMIILCVCLLAMAVHAASGATEVRVQAAVSSDGRCQVNLMVNLHLDNPASGLTFPLPRGAENVTMNGASLRTYSSASDPNVIVADLSDLNGIVGDYTLNFSYTMPDVLRSEQNEKTKKMHLVMEIPLLCGFDYPVDQMSFSITMPGNVTTKPSFTSGMMQTSIESIIDFSAVNQLITGSTKQALQDRETVSLVMEVTEEMFPGKLVIPREGNPEIIPMSICGLLALVYWIIFMRTLPVIRQRRATPIEGITAGELGCRLTAAGSDLTMMVFTWAQLGYLRLRMDRQGRVILEKRMDMGNERTEFEVRVFRSLFAKSDLADATGFTYARLCRSVARTVSGVREMYGKQAGNVNIFRVLACGVSIFCGVCYAMNMTANSVLQTILSILFVILGAVTAWGIQDGMYKLHVRGKIPMYVGLACGVLWIILGIVSGPWLMGLVTVLVQNLAGLMAAYGGRRSDLGRYNASQILGLRHYLKHLNQQEVERQLDNNPDYFFDMLPYAIALGVDTKFAKAFADLRVPECSYLLTRRNEKRSAREWALLVRRIADRMDELQRKMELEKWIPLSLASPAPRRRRR